MTNVFSHKGCHNIGTTAQEVGTQPPDFDITYAETWQMEVNVWLMLQTYY